MKGSSQVILGATLVMAASLAIVLGLVLVLLAELYCSLLLRRRRSHGQHHLPSMPAASSSAAGLCATPLTIPTPSSFNPSVPSPLSSFYAQGVLHAPRSLLFPALPSPDDTAKGHHHHQYRFSDEALELNMNSVAASPSPNSIGTLPGRIIREDYSLHVGATPGAMTSHLVYISNPIYYNDASKNISINDQSHNTPFRTPDSSPSHIESGTSSGADDEYDDEEDQTTTGQMHNKQNTPPLTPMKKLPAQASSVALRDAGSICTSGTDSNTNKGLLSSPSSGSPCTSPSWS